MSLDERMEQIRQGAYRLIIALGLFVSSVQLCFKILTDQIFLSNSDMWADLIVLSSFGVALGLNQVKAWHWVDRLIVGSTAFVIAMQTIVFGHPVAFRWLVLVIVGLALILERRRYVRSTVFIAGINTAGVVWNVFILEKPLGQLGFSIPAELVPALLVPWLIIPVLAYLLRQRQLLVEQLLISYVQLEHLSEENPGLEIHQDDAAETKYRFSQLDQKQLEEMVEKTLGFFETSDAYLNPNFQMNGLAKAVQIPRHQMSQVLNLGMGMSFYEILNHYRVEEVIRRFGLEELKDQSILDIAFSVGFNSKSTFNAAFKRQTGKTPSQYRESLQGGGKSLE